MPQSGRDVESGLIEKRLAPITLLQRLVSGGPALESLATATTRPRKVLVSSPDRSDVAGHI